MGALAAGAATIRSGVDLSYTAADGSVRIGGLGELWNVAFEYLGPVRRFPAHKGQTNFQGSWWTATTGEHVGFESWLERDNLMLLDFDPDVTAIASQPFWLSWPAAGRKRRHCPDYFVRLADGTAVVVDVRADDRIDVASAEAFAVTERACEAVGWRYRRVGAPDPVLLANVRWLAGYRHVRCFNAAYAARLQEAIVAPCSLAAAVGAAGDRLAVLPTLYHLLWSGVIRADLHASPLTAATSVTFPGAVA